MTAFGALPLLTGRVSRGPLCPTPAINRSHPERLRRVESGHSSGVYSSPKLRVSRWTDGGSWDRYQAIACRPRCKAETGRGRMSATNLFADTEDYTLPLRTHTSQLPA